MTGSFEIAVGCMLARVRGLAMLAGVLAAISLQGTVCAQAIFRSQQGIQVGRFIEPPRIVEQQLREAERALSEQRYSDVVVGLGDLLSIESDDAFDGDLSGQDFFLDSDQSRPSGAPLGNSLLRSARNMIGELPAAGMETYELRYGPLARKELNEASLSRDWLAAREVRRKYFHTTAGYEASYLLAQRELFEGRPLGASLFLDDVVRTPRALQHLGRGVLLLHAAALHLSGRDLPAQQHLGAGEEIWLGEQRYLWPADEQRSEWLTERFGLNEDQSTPRIADYPMLGARANRNGASSGELPLSNERWMLDTASSPLQEREVKRVAEELATSGKLPPPSWVPLRVGEQLLMRTTERLVGVDFRTGKRVWTYPWQSGYEYFEEEEPSIGEIPSESAASELLTQRVWNDVPYGQLSSDGERVYILDDLGEVEMATLNPMLNLRGVRPADVTHNTLVALELATEGKLLWRLGGGAEETSSLSDAFFLGPPLPLDGRLYVMAEIAGDINVCCLDPQTGTELWRQHLVAVESGGLEADPIRRVAGAMPTYCEGLLVCPTGAGAIVAIDLADRMLRWGVSFERNAEMIRSLAGRGRGPETAQLMQRWFSGTAVIAERAIVVTPVESDRLFGFDLLTGESLFPEKNRVHMKYLAGIRNGRFFVAGSSQIRAFDLRTGTPEWTSPRDLLSAGQQIAGLGVFGDSDYLLPTTANQIVRVSLDDGSVLDRRETRFPLGNLVAVDGEVIAQGPTSLAVAYGEATLEPLVREILEKNPDDFHALVRKSQLLIQRGDRKQALKLLSRAREIKPGDDEVRMHSVSAMLGTLRDSQEVDPELVASLDQLIDRPAERVELLALQVRTSLRNGQRIESIRHLLDLSDLVASEPLLDGTASAFLSDSARQCSLDAWLTARVVQLASEASVEELGQINALVQQKTESNLRSSTGLIRQRLRHFGSLMGAEPLRLELASRLGEELSWLELERLALGIGVPSDEYLSSLSSDRLWMLAQAYASGSMPKDVIRVLDLLTARSDQAGDPRIVELRELAMQHVQKAVWPQEITVNWETRQTRIMRAATPEPRVAETRRLAGLQFEGWRLISDGSSPLALRDPFGMLRRIQFEGGGLEMDKEAEVSGGVMVVVMPDGLMVVDLYRFLSDRGVDAVLWQRSLSGDGGPIARRRSTTTPFDDQVVRYNIGSTGTTLSVPEFRLGPVMGDRVLLLQGGELLAIDLLTKETLWRNSSAPLSGAVLCDGQRVAVVSPSTAEVVFFDAFDGRNLGAEPWLGGEIWAAIGTNVLSYRGTGTDNEYDLQLTDPFIGKILMQHQSVGSNRTNSDASIPSAFGRVIDGRHLLLLDNGGNTLIWDLVEGREVSRVQLPADGDLVGLNALILDGLAILLPRSKVDPTGSLDAPQLQTSDARNHVTVNAVHAISLSDGTVQWGHEFDKPWGCTLTQPADTPLLMMARTPFTYSTTSRRETLEVLAINVRDGSFVDQSENRPTQGGRNELETRVTVLAPNSKVMVQLGTQTLTYSFGEPAEVEAHQVLPSDAVE